jgi:uncharacterized membrane protein
MSLAPKPPARDRGTPWPAVLQRLRASFLAGLVIVLPVGLTILLLIWAIRLLDGWARPMVPGWFEFRHVAGVGVAFFVVLVTVIGAITRNIVGRRTVDLAERAVGRVPIARRIYLGVKQIVETGISKSGTSFRQSCLVEYPKRGLWTVVALAGPVEGELPRATGEPDLVALVVPTAPNPITGFLIFAPRRDIVPLDLGLDEAAKLVLSMGLVGPPGYAPQGPPETPRSS